MVIIYDRDTEYMCVNVFNLMIHVLLLIHSSWISHSVRTQKPRIWKMQIGFYSYMINLMSFNTLHIMLMIADITMKYNKFVRHVLRNEM